MPFQFAYSIVNSGGGVPVAGTFPMSGTLYNDGDLLTLNSSGQAGTVAAGDPGTVVGVFAGTRNGGTVGQQGTILLISRDQVWKCSTNAATYNVSLGSAGVQVLNAGTVNSVAGTTTQARLYNGSTLDGNGNVVAYVQFLSPSF